MSLRTMFLSRLVGLYCLVCVLAIIVHRQACLNVMSTLQNQPATALWMAMLTLLAGLAMVVGHNFWSGGVPVVIVTLVGWITLIKGVALLFLPTDLAAGFYQELVQCKPLYYACLAIPLALGAYLTYEGFRSKPA